MGFKDMVFNDIKNVFLNPDELGEPHIIDGREMNIIIDENELIQREKKYKTFSEGLHKKQLLFYVAAEDYGTLPLINRLIELDEEYYRVIEVTNENGIYSISLEANEE